MTTAEQRQAWRGLAGRLSYFGDEGRAQDAITALLADVDRLTAERDALAAELAQVRAQLAGGKPQPSAYENEQAEERIRKIDLLYHTYGHDHDKWPYHARARFEELDTAQTAYEAKYC